MYTENCQLLGLAFGRIRIQNYLESRIRIRAKLFWIHTTNTDNFAEMHHSETQNSDPDPRPDQMDPDLQLN
jgi:hypothetical protein